MEHWHSIFCKPRQDARAALHLANQGYCVYRPLARVRHGRQYRIESLFPRYLFIRLADQGQSWAPIRSTRGVAGLVQFGSQGPVTVPDELVADLKQRSAEHGWVDLEAARIYRPDEPVAIVDGVFAGCEAIFQCRTGDERVVVLLNLLGATRTVVLPQQAITQAGT